jgi:uncharacterized membrane-anchored protein
MYAAICALLFLLPAGLSAASAHAAEVAANAPAETPAQKEFLEKLRSLKWVEGPTTVQVAGNATLAIPDGYVFLDQRETDKFLEMNQNMGGGTEVLVAPKSLDWSAYLSFAEEGYVKDDEKIDAGALLKSLQEGTEAGNSERRRRGWAPLHVRGWAVQPAYNAGTKRLEWATRLESEGSGEGVNFFTKILGRRGYTTVVLVSEPDGLQTAESALNRVLKGYSFKTGETYAEFVPGDKVAEYGLAALVLGGAAAIATKKGLWGIIGGALAASWKFVAAGAVALSAGLRKLFAKKES